MQVLLKRFKKEEKGFTLIELLAVIVILAVIAVIAVPLIGNIINKTKADSDIATARQVYDAARLYVTSELSGDFNGTTDTGLKVEITTELISKGYLETGIVLPSTKVAINAGQVIFNSTGVLVSVTMATDGGTTLATVETTNKTNADSKFYSATTVMKSGN